MEDTNPRVNGTLIWYYHICKREVWLMAHNIVPDQDNPNIDLGRFMQENTYQRDKKEISVGNLKFDILKKVDGQVVIGEVKKSSKFKASARMQLAYYLLELRNKGIDAVGLLMFPGEKKREEVILTDKLIDELASAERAILDIIYRQQPPKVDKSRFCSNCGYREFCWS